MEDDALTDVHVEAETDDDSLDEDLVAATPKGSGITDGTSNT